MTQSSLPQRMNGGKHALTCCALLASLLVTCGPELPAPTRGVRGGDSLFDLLADARIEELAESNMQPALLEQLRLSLAAEGWTLAPSRWSAGDPLNASGPYRRFFPGDAPMQRWRCEPQVSFALGLGELWFEHAGRPLLRREAEGGRSMWFDEDGGVLFSTLAGGNTLLAFGTRAPGELRYGYRPNVELPLSTWEHGLFTADGEARLPQDLAGRLTLGDVNRPCLRVGTPSVLEWELEAEQVDTLELSIGTVDLAFHSDDGRLMSARGGSDGVTFAVELEIDGARQRLWSQHLPAGTDFEAHSVDLGDWERGPARLRLVTEGGPAGDTTFDYGAWSGLRLGSRTASAPRRPHLVLIDVDTLRADRVGCYGYARDTTPRLDAWAEQHAALFVDALATSNWTLPSTASMLTGLSVQQHGVTTFRRKLVRDLGSVALRLSAAGYETYARSDAGLLVPELGFGHGFDRFEARRLPLEEHLERGWKPELERLRERGSERPSFTFLQTYMTHDPFEDDRRFEDTTQPYSGPLGERAVVRSDVVARLAELDGAVDPADKRHLDNIYDAGVRRMDDLVMDFIDGLAEVFGSEPYLVILTSDHGEEILEHGSFGHGHSLHGEVLRVPLIVKSPDGKLRGRRSEPASLLDVAPTLLHAANLAIPEELTGHSLLGALPEHRPRLAQHENDMHDEPAFALTFLGRKWIEGPIHRTDGAELFFEELYELADDPGETRDRAEQDPEAAERLATLLRTHLEQHTPVLAVEAASDLSENRLADLEALGYVDGG
ncbi:MAG: hypothetical protein DHS20C15_30700 [Planctomycetota bacterium]|nr:MAG: hypothetical protein DHS20C15_30700 [Planctomycetota bacterium]